MFDQKEHRCPACGHKKKYNEFYLRNYKPNGICKECYRLRYQHKKRRPGYASASFAALNNLRTGV